MTASNSSSNYRTHQPLSATLGAELQKVVGSKSSKHKQQPPATPIPQAQATFSSNVKSSSEITPSSDKVVSSERGDELSTETTAVTKAEKTDESVPIIAEANDSSKSQPNPEVKKV